MIVCICNQTEGHTCVWHSVHGQCMTNFSEEQLLKEGVYDIKAVYDDVNETFVDSVAVSFVFLLFKYDFFN